MEPFVTHRGRVAVLDWTRRQHRPDHPGPLPEADRADRLRPPALRRQARTSPGGAPDADDPEQHGADDPDFPLNRPSAQGATVLVVGRNFGCGSSREHAVWAVAQAGYRAVIAPGKGEGFADIFEGNAFNNGLLPIELPEADWQAIADAGRAAGGAEVTIDLRDQTVTLHPARRRRRSDSRSTSPKPTGTACSRGSTPSPRPCSTTTPSAAYERNAPAWITPQPSAR